MMEDWNDGMAAETFETRLPAVTRSQVRLPAVNDGGGTNLGIEDDDDEDENDFGEAR